MSTSTTRGTSWLQGHDLLGQSSPSVTLLQQWCEDQGTVKALEVLPASNWAVHQHCMLQIKCVYVSNRSAQQEHMEYKCGRLCTNAKCIL